MGFYKTKDSLNYLYMKEQFKKDSLNTKIINNLSINNKKKSQQLRKDKTKITILTTAFVILIIVTSIKQ